MIVVVGEPLYPTGYDTLVIDPVIVGSDRYAKHEGIRRAMSNAVSAVALGDLIMQDDVALVGDPFTGEPMPGCVRSLVAPVKHHCPQAFILYDEPTRRAVLDAWTDTRDQACVAWRHLTFVTDMVAAEHRGRL